MDPFLLGAALVAVLVVWWYFRNNKSSGTSSLSFLSSSSTSFKRIGDNFKSLDEISAALRKAGLESCNLILAVDFTKSNIEQGNK
jgi:E3 ubiquitin-protein ligase RGLG